MKIPSYLSFWENQVTMDIFLKWGSDGSHWKELMMNNIIEKKYKNLLDIGAGSCDEYFRFKKAKYDIDYKAIEITNKFIIYAKERGINIEKANLYKLPFDNESFDVTICYDVLNHQKSFKEPLSEIIRVTKNEAIISFFKPFAEEEDAKIELENSKNFFNIDYSKEDGICLERYKGVNNSVSCIYNFFYLKKIKILLNSFDDIDFTFFKVNTSKKSNNKSYINICRISKLKNVNNSFFIFKEKRSPFFMILYKVILKKVLYFLSFSKRFLFRYWNN